MHVGSNAFDFDNENDICATLAIDMPLSGDILKIAISWDIIFAEVAAHNFGPNLILNSGLSNSISMYLGVGVGLSTGPGWDFQNQRIQREYGFHITPVGGIKFGLFFLQYKWLAKSVFYERSFVLQAGLSL